MINFIALFIFCGLASIITMAYYEKKINRITDAHKLEVIQEQSKFFKAGWEKGSEFAETEAYFDQLKKELNIHY